MNSLGILRNSLGILRNSLGILRNFLGTPVISGRPCSLRLFQVSDFLGAKKVASCMIAL